MNYLGVRSNNHTRLELEVQRKKEARAAYKHDLNSVLKSFGTHIPKSKLNSHKAHLKQIYERLCTN